ncbi:tail protein X [Faucicola atlantae]|uniref:Phage Tail Protein X n=1 Tax=Faucicola atlantae TaxID=34059 RepID=A0A1B8QCU9_9GAMM|nr:tail protein X [Moraxella atlantae]OBX79126.1 hypothetical protein A9306_08930 [Moraxella atlantae]
MTDTRQVTSKQGDTLDMICQRYFGYTAAITEQVMSLNPHLRNIAVLASGVSITLPIAPPVQTLPIIALWD